MNLYLTITVAFTGLIIGSFLNAVIYRLSNLKTILKARSECPSCRHLLGVKDLFPVLSFLLLGGRCRYCRQSISLRYPLVEMGTAVLFVLFFWKFSLSLELLLVLPIICCLIVIFVYDIYWQLILDIVSVPAIILALILNIYRGIEPLNFLAAAAIGGGFFLAQYLISNGRWIGGGDIRLGIMMGLLLCWPMVLMGLFISYVGGAVISLALLGAGKVSRKQEISFGPFLVGGIIIVMLFGEKILGWYLNLI